LNPWTRVVQHSKTTANQNGEPFTTEAPLVPSGEAISEFNLSSEDKLSNEFDHISQEEPSTIPAFTVLDNGSIVKNISLLHKQGRNQGSDEQILLVGQHPDCHITLPDPGISTLHLLIQSRPSLHMISVADLASRK
jgi:hypothetical protein